MRLGARLVARSCAVALRGAIRWLGILGLGACRPSTATTPDELDLPLLAAQPDYGTETHANASAQERAWLQSLLERPDDEPVRHDARLDAIAEHVAALVEAGRQPILGDLAARGGSPAPENTAPDDAGCVARPRNTPGIPSVSRLASAAADGVHGTRDFHHGLLERWAHDVGTPYFPFVWVLGATDDLARDLVASIDALPGSGPIAVGLAARDEIAVLVAARAWFTLPVAVPKTGPNAFALDVREQVEPELIVARADGVQRVHPSATQDRRVLFSVPDGLSSTAVEIVGRSSVPGPDPLVRHGASSTLGWLRFDDAPVWESSRDDALVDTLSRVRASLSRPLRQWIASSVDCNEPPPVEIAGQTVALSQSCLTLPVDTSAGRASMLTARPLLLEALADPRWEFAELDASAPTVVRIRFSHRFVARPTEEVCDELLAMLAERWPDSRPSDALDGALAELLERWAQTDVLSTLDAFGDDLAELASRWSTSSRYFRVLIATQDPAEVLPFITPDTTPVGHAVAVGSGQGSRGEPLYLIAVVLAIP